MAFEGDIHQILDHMYDRLYVVDRERKIQFWNRAAERITGYRAGEITGTCCADNVLIHVDDAGCSLCQSLGGGHHALSAFTREAYDEIFTH